jgi:hypothetical protein
MTFGGVAQLVEHWPWERKSRRTRMGVLACTTRQGSLVRVHAPSTVSRAHSSAIRAPVMYMPEVGRGYGPFGLNPPVPTVSTSGGSDGSLRTTF